MAFLPWQQVNAPDNSTAASFMKLAMQGVENAGTSFSEAAKGAADIQKNKADMAREKANALLTGQVLNAPDSEAASRLMQDALTASGDSGLFNTQSLQDAQDVRKTRIDTESAEVDLKFKEDTLKDRTLHEQQRSKTNEQLIEDNEDKLANLAATDAVNAMAPVWRTAYLDTGSMPSTEVMESMLDEYFKSNNIDPKSSRAQLISTKFASQAIEKSMAVALEVDGKLNPEQAATQGKKIADGTPDVGSTATVDVLNKTGTTAQVAKNAITHMSTLGGESGKEWDTKTTGASTPQEWESKLLMLAGKHSIPAGQLQMAINMGFRDVSNERGFLIAAAAAQQQYIKNKEFEAEYSETERGLAKVTEDIRRKELSFKMLLGQDGTLTTEQIADKKYEIDELKKAEKRYRTALAESELERWADPFAVKVAVENLPKGSSPVVEAIRNGDVKEVNLAAQNTLVQNIVVSMVEAAGFLTKDTKGSKEIKGSDLLTDSEALGRWREGNVKSSEARVFSDHIINDPELKEKYSNWYSNNIIQASDGNKKAANMLTLKARPALKAFMQHHAIVSEAGDAIREAELNELNMDNIVNELSQNALSVKGMTPVEPIKLSGSGRANTSKKGPNKDGAYISDWANPNRNPDPSGATTVKLRAGEGIERSVRPVVNDFFQEKFGKPMTAPEWQAIQYDLITSVGNNRTLDNTVSRDVEIPNELLEQLFSRQN